MKSPANAGDILVLIWINAQSKTKDMLSGEDGT